MPKKRTALGRFKHEGAESIVAEDGRVVFYLGDDERFDYVYKFVTAGTFNADDRAANMDLLDDGTLYVAKFAEDGTLEWLPLVHRPGAADRRERLCQPGRRADRDPPRRRSARRDQDGPAGGHPAERRQRQGLCHADQQHQAQGRRRSTPPIRAPKNAFGHIIEIIEEGGDFAATKGKWEVLLKCGDPSVAEVGASFSTATTANGWFGMPDNCAVDSAGRLWVATDGNSPEGDRPHRRPVGGRHRRRGARHLEAVLPRAGRRRNVRPAVHAGRRDRLRRRPASGRRRRRLGRLRPAVLLRGPVDPLARLQATTCRCARRSWRSPSRAAARSAPSPEIMLEQEHDPGKTFVGASLCPSAP